MTMSPARTAAAIARRIQKAGFVVDRQTSRQSRSEYLYVNIAEDLEYDHSEELEAMGLAPFQMITIRVSDHLNPARRMWRVSGSGDHAIEADIEVRTDRAPDWRAAADEAIAAFAPTLAAIKILISAKG